MIPRVYSAIHAVTAAFSRGGIPAKGRNREDDYDYRCIDDLYAALSPLLAEHKLCVLPRVLERTSSERIGSDGEALTCVAVRSAFDLVSVDDGSVHTIEAFGEALDHSDKATAKAMTAAYKSAMFEAFCIPVIGAEDADDASPRLGRRPERVPELALRPEQGWDAWLAELQSRVCACDSCESLIHLQNEERDKLGALKRERPELYQQVGAEIASRRQELAQPTTCENTSTPASRRSARRRNRTKVELSHSATPQLKVVTDA